MSQENREDEASLPRKGLVLVSAIAAGILASLGFIGWLWRLVCK